MGVCEDSIGIGWLARPEKARFARGGPPDPIGMSYSSDIAQAAIARIRV
jgi:hypothetical protein